MATLREFVFAQSSLTTGATIREHIKHPKTGGDCKGGDGTISANVEETAITVDVQSTVNAIVDANDEIVATAENIVATTIKNNEIEVGVCK